MFKFLKKIFNKLPIKKQKISSQNLKEINKQKETDEEFWYWVTQKNLEWLFNNKK